MGTRALVLNQISDMKKHIGGSRKVVSGYPRSMRRYVEDQTQTPGTSGGT